MGFPRRASVTGVLLLLIGLLRLCETTADKPEPSAQESFATLQEQFQLGAWDLAVDFPSLFPMRGKEADLPAPPGGYAPWRSGDAEAFLSGFPEGRLGKDADARQILHAGLDAFLDEGLLLLGDSTTRYLYDVLCTELVRRAGLAEGRHLALLLHQTTNQEAWETTFAEQTAQCRFPGQGAKARAWPLWYKGTSNVNATLAALDATEHSLGDQVKRVYVGLPALHSLFAPGDPFQLADTLCSWGSLKSFEASLDTLAVRLAQRQASSRWPVTLVASAGESMCLHKNEKRLALAQRYQEHPNDFTEGVFCHGRRYSRWLFDDEGIRSFNAVTIAAMARRASSVPLLDFYALLDGDRLCPFSPDGVHGTAPVLLTEIALLWAAFFHMDARALGAA